MNMNHATNSATWTGLVLAALVLGLLLLASCAPKAEPTPVPPPPPEKKVEKEVPPKAKPKPPKVHELVDSPPKQMYLKSKSKLLSTPDRNATVVSTLPKGDKVSRMKRRGSYAYVRVHRNGLSGWLKSASLSDKMVIKSGKPKERVPEVVRERVRQHDSTKGNDAVIFENF